VFPYVVIDRLTIWQAAAHPSSLRIVLGGFLVVLPFLIAYTAYAHRVFGGKVREPLY
jgi:cytochrome bd ubiquinol oxidase subunit II